MANQVVGTIVSIGQTQDLVAKNGNAFQKRDLVISVRRFDPNTGEPVTDWENTPKLSFMGERCRDLDRFQKGQVVVVSFDLQGRKYENANNEIDIITEARPYRIELYGQRGVQQSASQPSSASSQANTQQETQAVQPTQYPQQAAHPVQTAPQSQQPAQQQYYPQQRQSFKDPFPRS